MSSRVSNITTYHPIDEFEITGALGVAIPSAIFGTSLVGGVLGHTSVLVHRHEVESTVQAARKVRDIDIKCELLVEQVEHLVVGVILHQIQTRADVGSELTLGDEVELHLVAAGYNSVSGRIVGALESTVGSACLVVRAESRVPGVPGVAVLGATLVVQPAPVGVDDHFGVLRGAGILPCAYLPGH